MITNRRSKILVVDDKPENLYAMESLLQACDADVLLARSGNEALAITLHHRIALILLDVQMPEMDGFETASLIRQDDETRHVPIIFMTALSTDMHYVFQGYEAGAVDYLTKPVESEVLLGKVRVFLELDRYQRELASLNQRHELLLKCAGEGILGIDRTGRIQFANSAACQILDCSEQELCTLHLHQILFSQQADTVPAWEQSPVYLAYEQAEQCYRVDDGCFWGRQQKPIAVEFSSAPLRNMDGEIVGGVIVFQDITLRKKTEQKLLQLAQYDPLTGLANRNLFQDFLGIAIGRAQRRKRSMAILLLDLDHFKDVNDTMGHDVGDRLLKSVAKRIRQSVGSNENAPTDVAWQDARLLNSVAQRLKENLRRSDLVARLGGDEFAVVLDEVTDSQDAAVVAQRILEVLAPPHQLEQYEVYISPSIGIATYPECGEFAEALVKAADTALYQAKSQGRNNYQFYAPEVHRAAVERMRLEQDLRTVIEGEQLFLHYQPQFDVTANRLVGIEALIRWRHPELGMVSPLRFIPLAERMGIMGTLGDWVLERACRQLAVWRKEGLVDHEVRLAVNISSCQLTRQPFVENMRAVLGRYDLPSDCLKLELTENALIGDLEAKVSVLVELRALGVRIELDNFGTGYSSFEKLQSLPVDCLKVAQPFVSKIGQNTKNDLVIRTIVSIAQSLGFDLVAEGVETLEQSVFLNKLGCPAQQGYHICPPQSAEQITKMLHKQRASRSVSAIELLD